MKWLIFFNWIISTESNPNVCTFIPISNIILTLIEIVLLKRMYNMKISSILLLPTSYGKNMMEPLANNSHVRSLFELLSVQWILNVCMFKWNGLAAIIYLSSFITASTPTIFFMVNMNKSTDYSIHKPTFA